MTQSKGLRDRIKEAGGFYHWFNSMLIRRAGPPQLGPLHEPIRPPTPQLCPVCHRALSLHSFDRSGPKPIMACPGD